MEEGGLVLPDSAATKQENDLRFQPRPLMLTRICSDDSTVAKLKPIYLDHSLPLHFSPLS